LDITFKSKICYISQHLFSELGVVWLLWSFFYQLSYVVQMSVTFNMGKVLTIF